MASNIRIRTIFDIAGQPLPFTQPFVTQTLELEQDPAVYQVTIAADSTAIIWEGAPPITTYDILGLMATLDCHAEFTVNGGQPDEYHFTLPLRQGGFPIIIPGGTAYAGQTGTEDAFIEGTLRNITKIRVRNADTTNDLVVSVLIGKAAS